MSESLSREQIYALVERLVDERLRTAGEPRTTCRPRPEGAARADRDSVPHSRRWLLAAGAGAAAAGVGSALLSPDSAAAASGSALLQGGDFIANNAGTSDTDLTSATTSYTLNVHNSSTSTSPNSGIAIGAYTTANAPSISAVNSGSAGTNAVAAHAISANSTNGYGVIGTSTNTVGVIGFTASNTAAVAGDNTGSAGGPGVQGTSTSGYGVSGVTAGGTAGVYGINNATSSGTIVAGVFGETEAGSAAVMGRSGLSAVGVWGSSQNSWGVYGQSTTSFGIVARGGTGQPDMCAQGVYGSDSGRFLSLPFKAAGAPTTGTYTAGEQIRDVAGQLWLCITTGSPGVWQKVAASAPGANGGSTNMLATPFRLYDSRSGATDGSIAPNGPIQSGAGNAITLQVTGTAPVGGSAAQGVPAGAIGIVGTITVTNTQGAGYLVAYPAGGSAPGTSNVNMTASGQTVASAYTAALSSVGAVTIQCGGGPTDFILDITGYIY